MEKMNVIQRLAPNYWLGYYAVYLVTLIFLCARHRDALMDWSDERYIFTLAAIYTASVGTALTLAIIAEGVGYVVLLIPKRIKQLKDEGRREGIEQGLERGIERGIEQGLERGVQQGIEQGLERGREQGIERGVRQGLEQGLERGLERGLDRGLERGRAEERERVGKAMARFKSGEITFDELERLTSDRD